MKKVLSIVLAFALIASLFCINVSATSPTETLIFSQDFEDIENNNVMAAKDGYLQTDETGNHYISMAEGYNDPGWITSPFSMADGGIKVTFKVRNTLDTGWSLLFEAYEGDQHPEHDNGYILRPENYENDVWYDVTIVMRGLGVSAYENKVNHVAGAATKADGTPVDFPGTGVTAVSTNSIKVKDEEGNQVQINNYYNQCRFLGHSSYGANGTADGSTGMGWDIDDVKIYQLENDAERQGVYFYQDFDNPQNKTWVMSNHVVAIRASDSKEIDLDLYDFSNKGKEGLGGLYYADAETTHYTTYSVPAEKDICVYGKPAHVAISFDICKKAPSACFYIHVGLGGTASYNLVRFGVPANQLRQDVWYRYVAVVDGVNSKGNPVVTYYRKAEDADSFELLTAASASTVIETLEEGQTTDVAKPVYFSGATMGNSNSRITRLGIMSTTYTKASINGSELDRYQYVDNEGVEHTVSQITGSRYVVDNFKVADYVDLETIFEDGKARVAVNTNNPADTTAKKAMIVSFGEDGRFISADLADSNGTLEELVPVLDGATSVKLFVWNENYEKVLDAIDVTESFITAD